MCNNDCYGDCWNYTIDIVSWVLSTDFVKPHQVLSKFNRSVQADDKDSNQVDEKHPLLA